MVVSIFFLAQVRLGSVRPLGSTNWGFPQIRGIILGGPNNKDYTILGSILGVPFIGKLPNIIGGFLRTAPDEGCRGGGEGGRSLP